MMKFSAKFYLIAIISMFIAIADANSFFFLPPGPFSPTLDGAADASGGVEAGGNVITKINEKMQQFQTNTLEKIKSFQEKVESKVDDIKGKIDDAISNVKEKAQNWVGDKMNKLAGKLHSKEEGDSVVATSRDIADCKIADINNEESIIDAFKVLFGEYPADLLKKYPQDKEGIKKLYADKAIEFSNDAMIELYIASRELNERMEALQQEVDGMSDKYVTGTAAEPNPEVSGETGEANDELGSWVNYYKVAEIYDSILRITEELSALEAQYEAAQALRGGVTPEEPEIEDEGDEVSANEYFNFDVKSAVSYAQASWLNPAIFKKTEVNVKNDNLELIETKPRVATSPFKGTAAQFESLLDTNEIAFILNEALEAHNTIQQLANYKGPFIEYNRMKSLHYEVIDKLRVSENCIQNYLSRYYENPVSAWLGNGCIYGDVRNIFCDKDIKVSSSVLNNLVEGDHLCAHDTTKLCNDFSLNRYEQRGGLSGWLISAYKIAKAEKALEYGEVEFAASQNDVDVSASSEIGDIDEMGEQGDVIAANQNNNGEGNSYLRPSDEIRVAQNDRENDLLAWQLGALLSQKIGKAMSGNEMLYGKIYNKYPLWADEQYFYEKYLENKYENMEIFIRSLDMRSLSIQIAREVNDALYVEEDEEEMAEEGYEGPKMHGVLFSDVLSYNNSGLEALDEAIANNPAPTIDDVEVIQTLYNTQIKQLKADFERDLKAKQNEIADLYTQADDLSIKLNDTKLAYNEMVEKQMDAESKIEAESKVQKLAEEKSKKSSKVIAVGTQAKSIKNILKEQKLIEQYKVQASKLKKEIENIEIQIDDLKERIDIAKTGLATIKSSYAKTIAQKEYEKEIKVEEAYNKIKGVDTATLSALTTSATGIKNAILRDVIHIADAAAEIARQNAITAIREGYIDILDLDIFNPEEHDAIVDIHEEIMDRIQSPDIGNIGLGYLSGYVDISQIKVAAIKAISNEIYKRVCNNNICTQVDEQYYVGAVPNEKDFTAPKTIAPTYTPPLREIVHFDGKDFDNLNISDDYHITKDSLITVGAMLTTSCDGDAKNYFCENADNTTATVYTEFVPPIWKLILGPQGFVEKDVPIIPLLGKNYQKTKTDKMIEGGIYPCTHGNYTISVKNGEFLVSEKSDIAKCAHIKSIKIKGLNKAKFTTIDGVEIEAEVAPKYNENVLGSELGLFAGIDENGWVFNDDLRKVMKYLSELGDEYNKTDKYKSDSMIFDRNQFGDFLRFVEGEMEYQKSLDQLDVKVDNARATLLEHFAKFGFVPAIPEFDLSDDATYNAIVEEINAAKEERIKKASEMLDNISVTNELITENIEKLKNTLELLKLDDRELVSLSDSMTTDQVKEAITRADTDKETQGEYDKRIEDSYNDQKENYMIPYCAVY